jgi:putative glycosyltransferase (TIGR04372 family)
VVHPRTLARVALRVAVAPVVLALWLVRRRVRLVFVLPNVTLFGHLALEPEKHLARRRRTPDRRPRVLDVWAFGRRRERANAALTRMWRRRVTWLPAPLADAMHRVAALLPGPGMPVVDFDKLHENDDVLDDGPSFLRPTRSEDRALARYLDSVGIAPGLPYACIVVRDARFAPASSGPHASGPLRSRSFEDFLPAARLLADLGVPVVKVGSRGTFDARGLHPRIVDYANGGATDPLLDVMLPARATTVVSTMSGPDAVALAAHRPVLYVDLVQYSLCFAGTALTTWVPALLCDATGRVLTLREVFDSGAGRILGEDGFARQGLEIRRSSPAQIAAYVRDHVQRVTGGAAVDPRVEALQDRYRETYRELMSRGSVRPLGAFRSRLADGFVRSRGAEFLA